MKKFKNLLRNHPVFSDLPDHLIEMIIEKGHILKRENKEVLYSPHDLCESMTLIIEGRLRIEKILPNGKEITVNTLKEGTLISEACAFLGGNYPAWVVASGAVTVLQIPFRTIEELSSERKFSMNLITALSKKLLTLQSKLDLLSVNSAEQRVALYMMNLIGPQYQRSFRLTQSKTAIAKEIGISRETVSRVFSSLIEQGIITEVSKGEYQIVDNDKFSHILT